MATIKGQNLRVLMGADVGSEYCVIQATSCTAHVTMNVQESSTKDDTDGWVRNDITGMSWDITSEAQVSLSQFTMEASVSTGKTASGVKYRTATPIRLNKGQEITYCIDTSIPGATDKYIKGKDSYEILNLAVEFEYGTEKIRKITLLPDKSFFIYA